MSQFDNNSFKCLYYIVLLLVEGVQQQCELSIMLKQKYGDDLVMLMIMVFGVLVVDNQNSRIVGLCGLLLMEDVWLLEKLVNFNCEIIFECCMYVKGLGVFGIFIVIYDIIWYMCVKLFEKVGKQIEMFVCFIMVVGECGVVDVECDIRGFVLKFYIEEGNWDLVGNNMLVFFLCDLCKFVDFNKVVKCDLYINLCSVCNNWDFWMLLFEVLLQVIVVMSDRGILCSFCYMYGFGLYIYSFINVDSECFWVKFYFVSQQGIELLIDVQVQILVGYDCESYGCDLFVVIEKGDFLKWKLFIQVMFELEVEIYCIYLFDLIKVWLKSDYLLIEVGQFELNCNLVNWYQDVEQLVFVLSNLVLGIGLLLDKMLQVCLFVYFDVQCYCLGVNYYQILVNVVCCLVYSNYCDGVMCVDGNYGGLLYYELNSYGQWQEQLQYCELLMKIRGDVDFWNFCEDDVDYFSQFGVLFCSYNQVQKDCLFVNIVCVLGDVLDFIKQCYIDNCSKVDLVYGVGVVVVLKVLVSQLLDLFKLVQLEVDFFIVILGVEDIEF